MNRILIRLLIMALGFTACFAMHDTRMSAHAETGDVAETLIPTLTIVAKDMPQSDALNFVQDMKAGWNLGNTFDARAERSMLKDEMQCETMWCGVRTTPELIKAIQDAGFRTLRLPVSWYNHVDAEFNISEPWLARVEEVVRCALDSGMYVILNTHHDISAETYYPDTEHLDVSMRYVTRVWEQLAVRFADCGERLIFEPLNEPRLKDTEYEWSLKMNAPECVDAVNCINLLNQAFVNTVRAAGGQNAERYLLLPGYGASLDGATNDLFYLPDDTAHNRLIVSVHAYAPYAFALMPPSESGSKSRFSEVEVSSTAEIGMMMNKLYDQYVSKGIPVIIGEYGARAKGDNLDSRVRYAAYYTAMARARGITCCWWDNNAFSGNGEIFGLINRSNLTWITPEIVEAIMTYAQ